LLLWQKTPGQTFRFPILTTIEHFIEVWDSEWGYSWAEAVNDAPSNGHTEATRARQAVLAVREILTACAVGFPVAVWYDLRDDGPGAENPAITTVYSTPVGMRSPQ
jgi:hypothetical protein